MNALSLDAVSVAVALGEIGLDNTTHCLDWPRQERQFLNLPKYANTKDVVVVLLRDMSTDPAGREVYLRGLAFASEKLDDPSTLFLWTFRRRQSLDAGVPQHSFWILKYGGEFLFQSVPRDESSS